MGMLEQELARLDKEFADRRVGLIAAAGLIAEAEALAEEINNKVADEYYTSAAACVTSHQSGEVNVRVLILSNHARARVAIHALGLSIRTEDPGDIGNSVTSSIHLLDFTVPINMFQEPMAIAEAA